MYAGFTHGTGGAFAWAAPGVAFVFCVRKVLSVAELRRKLIHWATIAMLLVVVGRLEVAAGTIESVTRILIGIDAHIVFYNATGIILGPTAAKVAGEDTSIGVCMGYKADGTLLNGLEWGVARTEGCMRYLTPVDGEHSCAAFAATKAHFKFDDLRGFCGTWIKGVDLRPWDTPVPAKFRHDR